LSDQRKTSNIIIVGANFAGLSAASKLSKCHHVTVIDPKQNFEWTPNIHEILSDVKKQTQLGLNLTTLMSRLGHDFVNQAVVSIDPLAQTLTLDNKQTLGYDILLVATGHERSNYGVNGADKNASSFRNAADVIAINDQIEAVLNSGKKTITINIVGGGFTGVEILGELLRKYSAQRGVHINVIDSAKRLVQALPDTLSYDILSQCEGSNVNFMFNKKIIALKKNSIEFSDQSSVKSDITIWSAGTKLPSYLAALNSVPNPSGLIVNKHLQVEAYPNIFAAGDSAAVVTPLPKQASLAMDMGEHAAINIKRYSANKALKPFKASVKPILLSLGELNTYFIQGKLVLASPVLAAAKETVYQFYMARLSTMLPLDQSTLGLVERVSMSTEKLLLAEVLKLRPKILINRSKVL
jgi:NADH dehydrogenase